MDTFLQIALSNAVAAVVLAVPAAAARWFCRRPALVHSLWLLVLLKLVTPPFVLIPVLPAPPAAPTVVAEAEAPPMEPIDPAEAARILQSLPQVPQTATEEPAAVPAEPADSPSAPAREPLPWQTVVIAAWSIGSLLWLIVTLGRVLRFRRWLREATPAPMEICRQVRGLADTLGLRRCPQVLLIPGPLAPMLFAVGSRPRLLLPAALWSRLADEQRQTLLTHELAHYRRGDHWIRLLELLATGLYWWHPVVWWARQGLSEAEEECCDAWVVSTLPTAARAYATALMETVDFLSETRPLCPPAASGIGQLHMLKRRLTMIMRGRTPRALSWTGLLTVLALGAMLLPWLPTWAQDAPPTNDHGPATENDSGPAFLKAYTVPHGQAKHIAETLHAAFPIAKITFAGDDAVVVYATAAEQKSIARRLSGDAPTTFHGSFDAKSETCMACHTGKPQADAKTMALHDRLLRWLAEVDRDRQQVQSAEKTLRNARQHLQENEKRLQEILARFRKATVTAPRKTLPPLHLNGDGQATGAAPHAPANESQDQRLQRIQNQLDELRREMDALRRTRPVLPPPPTRAEEPPQFRVIPAPGSPYTLVPNASPAYPPLVVPDPKKNDKYYAPLVPLKRDKQG